MAIKPNGLHHSERLRTIGVIRRMFDSGQGGFVYPIRYVWTATDEPDSSAQVLFSVPKKFHKRANKRNTLRRRVKEAYRLQKEIVLPVTPTPELTPKRLDIAMIYSTKESHSYKTIENAVRKILQQIAEGN